MPYWERLCSNNKGLHFFGAFSCCGRTFFIAKCIPVTRYVNFAKNTRTVMTKEKERDDFNEIVISFVDDFFDRRFMAYCVVG